LESLSGEPTTPLQVLRSMTSEPVMVTYVFPYLSRSNLGIRVLPNIEMEPTLSPIRAILLPRRAAHFER
jgi:hypothetical protein